MTFKKLLTALAVTAALCISADALATCSSYTTYASGQTLTAASLNSLQTNYNNCTNAVLDGDIFTGNMLWHSGVDAAWYSDAGTTLKASIDGATGKIIGYLLGAGTYNIDLVSATTTNANDSIKIQCGGAACSATNPGFVVLGGTTAGSLTGFVITSDVTILLTGAHWGQGTKGDLTGMLLRIFAANDNATLRWCVGIQGGRKTVVTTDTTATATSATTPESLLCSAAVASSTNTVREIGYVRSDFDDAGGAAADLWANQTGVDDIVTGQTADGQWSPFNPAFVGFSVDPTTSTARWTMIGNIVYVTWYRNANGTSNSVDFSFTGPIKANQIQNFAIRVVDNTTIKTTPGSLQTAANSAVYDLGFDMSTTGGFTNTGGKAAFIDIAYEASP